MTVPQNPVLLHTDRAAQALGRLIRQWALDPKTPASINRTTFEDLLTAEMEQLPQILVDPPDPEFEVRSDIRTIDLIRREPNRAALLLPEQEVIEAQLKSIEDHGAVTLRTPRMYDDSSWKRMSGLRIEFTDKGSHTIVEIEADHPEMANAQDPFDKFVDGYMANYICSQCG